MGRRLRFKQVKKTGLCGLRPMEGPIRRWPVSQEERRRLARQEEEVYQE